ncbi:YbaB/EbfC family nucleoid-associated protein [Nocardia arthritidis]|uniref:YbaB/EbfC family DNA-binding protein n=1 Tax=Nocardia arthritidis TaxID=228602 RepID=A0A6G9Y7G2_9NOCA|nr:YbaB/EbfC family nucleoid-associated protein [Nocardia arthritidis]QIS08993.1 YbaB/EbfC family DNA-binding protein [Nocardia arthritidis]
MANEMAKARLAELMESVQAGIQEIQRMQREQVKLTASASAAGKRVTVVVNANGDVIETKFSSDIGDLTHAEIARAFTEAAQEAAAQVRTRTKEMVAEVARKNARVPRLSDFIDGMPDVRDMLPEPPEPSLEPPGRQGVAFADDMGVTMEFANVEEWEHDSANRSDVRDSGW